MREVSKVMIKIFYGDDRVRAQAEIKRELGEDYEVIEGAELKLADLQSIFQGASLLTDKRKIVIKDLGENKECFEKMSEFNTDHQIILWETKLDKRTGTYKKMAKIAEIKEFKLIQPINKGLAFDIYDMALRDSKRAIKMLQQVEATEDPYQMVGAWSWKAIDNFKRRGVAKEKRALKQLSKLDIRLKSTSYQPWALLSAFLLGLSQS